MAAKIVKHADGGPELTRAYACANSTDNDAIAAGDITMLSSGNLVIYADGASAQVAGIAEPYEDTGAPLNGIVPVTPLDLSGQYVMGVMGPTLASENRRIAVLAAGDVVRIALKANTTCPVGTAVGITGATGAQVADTAATAKVATVTEVETAPTASLAGVGLIRFLDSGVNPGA